MRTRFAAMATLLFVAIVAAVPASASPVIQGQTQFTLIPDGVTQTGIWCGFGVSSDPTSSNTCTFINPNNGGDWA